MGRVCVTIDVVILIRFLICVLYGSDPTQPPRHNSSTNPEYSLVPSHGSFFPEGDGTQIKTIQHCRCYPLILDVHQFARLDPVEDI